MNRGGVPQNLSGWRLTDIADERPEFVFPAWTLAPGQRVRVYTNGVHGDWGGFSFDHGRAIWSNGEPDEAGLFDAAGALVSTKSYPPGC